MTDIKVGPCGSPGSGWSYQYNPFTRRSECAPPNAEAKYNPITKTWVLAGRDWQLQLDPSTGEWVFRPQADLP